MFKFREPSFVEYLIYDVERFHEKGRREQFTICLQFLEHSPTLDALMLSDVDKVIRSFQDFITGSDKVVRIGH